MPNNRVVFSVVCYPGSHALHAFLLMGFKGLFRGEGPPGDSMPNIGMSASAYLLLVAIASALSGCPLAVNLNVSTDKPFTVYLIVDKPVEVNLDADLAVTKVPPIHADVGVSKLPPIRLGL